MDDKAKESRLRGEILPLLRCVKCGGERLQPDGAQLECAQCRQRYPVHHGTPVMLLEPGAAFEFTSPMVTEHVYSGAIAEVLRRSAGKRILDVGAGSNPQEHEGIVKLDVFALPHVDVAGMAEKLPFRDGVFDAVVSGAVLEHVSNPFMAADQMHRVLKEGGEVYIETAFLQPVHAYPNHFFNMTVSGAQYLFSNFERMEAGVQPYQNPSFTLHWLLEAWTRKLKGARKDEFLRATVGEILAEYKQHDLSQRWMDGFSDKDRAELACGVFFHGRKTTVTAGRGHGVALRPPLPPAPVTLAARLYDPVRKWGVRLHAAARKAKSKLLGKKKE